MTSFPSPAVTRSLPVAVDTTMIFPELINITIQSTASLEVEFRSEDEPAWRELQCRITAEPFAVDFTPRAGEEEVDREALVVTLRAREPAPVERDRRPTVRIRADGSMVDVCRLPETSG